MQRHHSQQQEEEQLQPGGRIVEQLGADTGKVFGRWPTAKAADRGLDLSHDVVGRVLRSTERTAGGFGWHYGEASEPTSSVGSVADPNATVAADPAAVAVACVAASRPLPGAAGRETSIDADDDENDESDSEFERDFATLEQFVAAAAAGSGIVDSDDDSDRDDSGGRTEEANEGDARGEETIEEAASGGGDDDDKDDEISEDDDAGQTAAAAAATRPPRLPTSRRLAALCGGDEVA
jgi:hypothetical protein